MDWHGQVPPRSRNPILQAALTAVLEALAAGPRRLPEVPRSWPVTRVALRMAVGELRAAGLIEVVDAMPAPLLRLTDRGTAGARSGRR